MDNRPYWAFMALVFTLIWIIDACSSAYAVSVTPASISTNSLSWWQGATSVSNASNAVVTRGVTASLLSSLGASNSLPANIVATIPRASLAASAANILKRAGGYGLAAYSVYSLVAPLINMNSDGTVTATSTCYGNSWQYYTAAEAQAAGQCFTTVNAACSALATSRNNYYYPYNQAAFGYSSGLNCYTSAGGILGTVLTYGQAGSTSTPTETALASQIQNSSASENALFDAALADAVAHSYSNDMVKVVPATTPVSISASPVTTPAEVVSTTTAPNADGSTTTTTKTAQTTATPQVTGTTAADAKLDWKTSTVTTSVAHNNTTGANLTTTETQSQGTTTTANAPETDLCKLHPTAAACLDLGSVPTDTPPAVSSTPIPASYSPPSSVAGSCPAPIIVTVHPPLIAAKTLSMSYQPACDFAGMIRLVVLACAGLGAAYIVSGSVRADA